MTFIGLEDTEDVVHVVIDRDVAGSTSEINGIPRATHNQHTADNVSLVTGKTLILGDSFMVLPRPSLVQYFADVAVVDWREEEGVDYFMRHASSANVIIIEISELNIWERFGDRDMLESCNSLPADIPTSN